MALVTSADAKVGALVRVSGTDNAGNVLWHDAKIEKIKDGEVCIHYAGCHKRHDAWFALAPIKSAGAAMTTI